MPEIGHNRGPDMAVTAGEVANDLSGWMKEHPVISTEDDAREAKVYIDRAKLCDKDLDAECDSKVRPLNQQVAAINDHYRGPRSLLKKVLDEIQSRLSVFLRAEEQKRIAAAADAQRKVKEAERIAREAEAEEQRRLADAASGELDIDVAALTKEADAKFAEFKRAKRQAVIAERDTKVKIGGGFRRAIGLKNTETIVVVNAVKAVASIGDNETINEAIIKAARAYKRLHSKYPDGIATQAERSV